MLFKPILSLEFEQIIKLQLVSWSKLQNAITYNGLFVPDSKITQIAMVFLCPTRKCNKLHVFVVPDSKLTQIAMFFWCPTRTCNKLHWLLCARLENDTNHTGLLCPTWTRCKLCWGSSARLENEVNYKCSCAPDSNMSQIVIAVCPEDRCWGSFYLRVVVFGDGFPTNMTGGTRSKLPGTN